MLNPPFSIAITGERSGCGQSTAAKNIADHYGFQRIYGGLIMRHLAEDWHRARSNGISWDEFTQQAVAGYQFDPSFQEKDSCEDHLYQLQQCIENSPNPNIWDSLIDRSNREGLAQPNTVVEGKLAILAFELNLVGEAPELAHPIINILLTCHPTISTLRVMKRNQEKRNAPQPPFYHPLAIIEYIRTYTNIQRRQERDWKRFKEYNVTWEDLQSAPAHHIDTTYRNPSQVQSAIIAYIQSGLLA